MMRNKLMSKISVFQIMLLVLVTILISSFFISPANAEEKINTIWIVNLDGTELKQLTTINSYPTSCSSDGKLTYVVEKENNQREIWIMDVDTEEKIQLTSVEENADLPLFSPNGKRILYTRDIDNSRQLWIMNADGTDKEALTKEGWVAEFDWSPDSEKIVYDWSKKREDIYKIFVLDLKDKEKWQIGESGEKNYFYEKEAPLFFSRCYKKIFFKKNIHFIKWSKDGKKIFYIHFGKKPIMPNSSLRMVNINGSGDRFLLEGVWGIRPSPDGTYLLIWCEDWFGGTPFIAPYLIGVIKINPLADKYFPQRCFCADENAPLAKHFSGLGNWVDNETIILTEWRSFGKVRINKKVETEDLVEMKREFITLEIPIDNDFLFLSNKKKIIFSVKK